MNLKEKEKAKALKNQLNIIEQLLKKPENKLCADCKRKSPSWASINLGVFVCINCSGCHREIGVHISKIKSINLDLWEPEVLNHFKIINNKIANKYWEHKLKAYNFKEMQEDNKILIEFIRNKYENKKWIDKKKKIDPMSLIIKGKMKQYKKLFGESDDEDEDGEINSKSKIKNNNRDNHKKKKRKKNKDEESEESEDVFEAEKKKKKDEDNFYEEKEEGDDEEESKESNNNEKNEDEPESDEEEKKKKKKKRKNKNGNKVKNNDNKQKNKNEKNKKVKSNKKEDDDDFEEVIENKTPIKLTSQKINTLNSIDIHYI